MMQQWHEMRAKLSDDSLLLFRLGDFYEVFNQDAERGAEYLGITLTYRHGMPMAGIPNNPLERMAFMATLNAAPTMVTITGGPGFL